MTLAGITIGGTTRVAGSLLYGADCGYGMNFENAVKSVFCDYPSLDDISTVTFLSIIYIDKKEQNFSTKVPEGGIGIMIEKNSRVVQKNNNCQQYYFIL